MSFEETVLSGEICEPAWFGFTNAGTEYCRIRVLVDRPWKRRGKRAFFSCFCYRVTQVALVRERGVPGAFAYIVGEHRPDWNDGNPQIRKGKDGPLCTYDLTCRTLDISDYDCTERQDKTDDDDVYPGAMQLVNGGGR